MMIVALHDILALYSQHWNAVACSTNHVKQNPADTQLLLDELCDMVGRQEEAFSYQSLNSFVNIMDRDAHAADARPTDV